MPDVRPQREAGRGCHHTEIEAAKATPAFQRTWPARARAVRPVRPVSEGAAPISRQAVVAGAAAPASFAAVSDTQVAATSPGSARHDERRGSHPGRKQQRTALRLRPVPSSAKTWLGAAPRHGCES